MNARPRTKPSPSIESSGKTLGAPIWPAVAWVLAFAGYFLLFGRGTLPVGLTADADMPRIDVLAMLPFPDVIVEEWFGDGRHVAFADRLPIVAVTLLFLAAAASLGRAFLAACGIASRLSWAESFAFSTAAGLNTLSLATLLIGLAGALKSRLLFVAPLTLSAAFGAVWLVRKLRIPEETTSTLEKGVVPLDATSRYATWALTLIAGLCAASIWLSGMIPPAEFDVREYHLQAPKEFYRAGRISFLPHNVYANMPLGAEMHALAAMVVCQDWRTGALVGKSLISLYGIVTAIGLYGAGSRLANRLIGALAATLYLSIPWVYHTSTTGLIEGAFALYVLMSWYAVWLSRSDDATGSSERTATGFLALAGWCGGAAVACKYPALLFVVAPLVGWLLVFPKRPGEPIKSRLFAASVFLLFAALAGGAWLAKNAAATGNPVYPLLYSVFDGATRTPEKDAQWTAAHDPPNFNPLDLGERAGEFLGGSPWQSVLLAPLAVLAIFSANKAVRPLGLFLLVDLVSWWLFTHRVDRFWTPFLPVWALIAALGVEAVWQRSAAWRWTIPPVVLIGCILSLYTDLMVGGSYNHNKYFVSLARLWNDDLRFERWHALLDERTLPGEAILFVGDPEPFDLESRVIYNTVFDDCVFEQLAKGKTPEQVHAELQKLGVTTVYVSWFWIDRYREPGNYGFSPYPTRELFRSLMNAGVFDPPLAPPKGTPRTFDEAYPVRKTFRR